MAYITFGDIKSFAMEMLSENELQTVFSQRLLPRWATRTRDRINEWHDWKWKQGSVRLTWSGGVAAGSGAVLYLPPDVGGILTMFPQNQSYRDPVVIIEKWEFDQLRPRNAISRGSDYLVLWGYYSVKADNPATGPISIAATGGASAQNVRVRVRGRGDDNEYEEEIVTLGALGTGATTKNFLGGAGADGVTHCEIEQASLVGKTGVGVITFTNGGTTLEELDADAGEVAKERRRSELYAQTGGSGTYQVSYYRRFMPLRADTDTFLPEMPNEYLDIPELGIMSQIAMFRKEWDARMQYELEFKQRLKELAAWSHREPGTKRRLTVNRQFGGRGRMTR